MIVTLDYSHQEENLKEGRRRFREQMASAYSAGYNEYTEHVTPLIDECNIIIALKNDLNSDYDLGNELKKSIKDDISTLYQLIISDDKDWQSIKNIESTINEKGEQLSKIMATIAEKKSLIERRMQIYNKLHDDFEKFQNTPSPYYK